MRFTNGRHQMAKDVTFHTFMEVYESEIAGKSLSLYCPGMHVKGYCQAFNELLGIIDITSPMPDVVCVRVSHYKGVKNDLPRFELDREDDCRVEIADGAEHADFISARLRLHIVKKPFALEFHGEDGVIGGCSQKAAGYARTSDGMRYTVAQLNLDVGECVYGLGEKFTPFVKNGQTVDMWNEDGGTDSWYSYKSVPFYMTNRGYGVFVNSTGRVSFEVGTETTSKVQFSVPGEQLEYYFIYGPQPKEILRKYTSLTGRPALLPAWSLGLYLSTSFCTVYNEKIAEDMLERMMKERIPVSIFYFCCFWMKEFHWCDFSWNTDRFPDPAGMLKRMKDKGVHVCVWINPYISQISRLFAEGKEKGYFLRRKNGDVWQWDVWQPGMAIVDFTNPEARKWYKSKIQDLLKMGVDSFKTDFGEQIPADAEYYDGSDPEKMHNYYSYLYNQTVFQAIQEVKGRNEALLYARASTAGGQRYPIHWGGDCSTDYVSMAESLRAGLSLCLSGFGYWSHDIGGFVGHPSPDLYKRWAAFGLLSSHSRLHGADSYRVPWIFGDEATDVLRFFARLRCRLMPYLYMTAYAASREGIPVMRAMMLEFPGVEACEHLDRQYMLGDSILVAPIFNDQGMADYYLPEGEWTNFITGEKTNGGCWRNEKHGYFSLPMMVRQNSIIALGARDDRADYDYADGAQLHLFALREGAEAHAKVFNTAGELALDIRIARREETVHAAIAESRKPFTLILRGMSACTVTEGGKCQPTQMGMMVTPDMSTSEIVISLK